MAVSAGQAMKRSLAIWLVMIACLVAGATLYIESDPKIDTSILSLLPEDQQTPLLARAGDQIDSVMVSRLVIMIGSDTKSPDALADITESATRTLSENPVFKSVESGISKDTVQRLVEFFTPYRYQLLSDEDRRSLATGHFDDVARRATEQLVNPMTTGGQATLVEDPLNFLGRWFENLSLAGGFKRDARGFYGVSGETHYRLLIAQIAGSPFDRSAQQKVSRALDRLHERYADGNAAVDIRESGVVIHAIAAANTAKSELLGIGLVSILVIVALLIWQFRTLGVLLLPALSISTGILVAVWVTTIVFGRIHVVTLAFGASLVGVSVDYVLHYLSACQAYGKDALRKIFPGIALGLITSCLAYGTQYLTPFPALQQIAVFSASGLVGAWLAVVGLASTTVVLKRVKGKRGALGPVLIALASKGRVVFSAMLVLLVPVAVFGWFQVTVNDDLAMLGSSSDRLIANDQLVRSFSHATGSRHFFVVEADSWPALLKKEKALQPTLNRLQETARLSAWQGISRIIPTRQEQRVAYGLVMDSLGSPAVLKNYFRSLGMPEDLASRSFSRLASHERAWLTPMDLKRSGVDVLERLWLGETRQGKMASIVTLGRFQRPGTRQELEQLAHKMEGVRFEDRVDRISHLLGHYRQAVITWLLAAYGMICLLLLLRYRFGVWKVVLPPALATALAIGLLGVAGQPINLFSMLAAFLILGIGLDVGIFLRESAAEIHAWVAVTLSTATSVAAFGMLALSKTPVLHYFGIMVLPGLILTWVLAFVLSPPGRCGRPVTSQN